MELADNQPQLHTAPAADARDHSVQLERYLNRESAGRHRRQCQRPAFYGSRLPAGWHRQSGLHVRQHDRRPGSGFGGAGQESPARTIDAEFGQAQAGVVTTSTKSGTNELHGSAFMFRRNDLTQARDPFSQSVPIDSSGRLIPQSLWSQFGGSIGGPIIKNRTFFFGDYQGTRAKDAGSVLLRVPTAAERTGDLERAGGRVPGRIFLTLRAARLRQTGSRSPAM